MSEPVSIHFVNLTNLDARFPLSRNVKHDPRSRDHRYQPRSMAARLAAAGDDVAVEWPRRISHLNQAWLGSCTGNGTTCNAGTDSRNRTAGRTSPALGTQLDEPYAIGVYSDATKIDPYQGSYPPTDSGSDGLSCAKVMKARGEITDYTHVLSFGDAKAAIHDGPFITGLVWLPSMFDHDENAIVRVDRAQAPEGGHEPHVRGRGQYFLSTGDTAWYWKLDNYWVNEDGTLWGDSEGSFYFSDADYAWLLSQDGDATVLHWKTSVTPSPVPPTPGPGAGFPVDLAPDVAARVVRAAARRRLEPEAWLNTHLRHYFQEV